MYFPCCTSWSQSESRTGTCCDNTNSTCLYRDVVVLTFNSVRKLIYVENTLCVHCTII
jgi:hypothetical protein